MSLCINPCCHNPETSDDQLFCPSCGSELLLQGRYRVAKSLGQGGFGKTYEIRDMDGTAKVLKILTKQAPKYIELFQREAMVLSQLNHPGIPSVEPNAYFIFAPKDSVHPLHCFVMEKISGLDFQKYIQQLGRPISQTLAVQWLIESVHILKAVHSQNFLHRDIKPSNIMLKADGRLALIDFGTTHTITKIIRSDEDNIQSTRIMSALYTPWEQICGRPVPQSDYFALGRTFVFLLTGQPLDTLYDPLKDRLDWYQSVPNLSQSLADFIDALMHPHPTGRPTDAEWMLQQLHEIRCGLQQPSTATFQVQGDAPNHPVTVSPPRHIVSMPSDSSTVPYPSVSETFMGHCRQKLAEFVGPMASVVCDRTLARNPLQSERELVEALANQIPNRQDSQQFKQGMFQEGRSLYV